MNSLWFETFNKTRQFPKISNNLSCDICIVGGGIFGITCAYYLTKQGFNVIVLEKDGDYTETEIKSLQVEDVDEVENGEVGIMLNLKIKKRNERIYKKDD